VSGLKYDDQDIIKPKKDKYLCLLVKNKIKIKEINHDNSK